MSKQPVLLDRKENQTSPSTPLSLWRKISMTLFTPKPVSEAALYQKQIELLLRLVAEGEQKLAEKMLKKDKNLLLATGTVKDLSGRQFKQITAFQYVL